MKDKECSKCGKKKPLSEYNKNKRLKDGHFSSCKKCVSIAMVGYYKENRKKRLAYAKNRYEENKEYCIALGRKYRKTKKGKKVARAKDKRYAKELRDGYVSKKICSGTNLKSSDIPNEMIEVKREHIKLGRNLKGIKDEEHERSKRKTG